MSKFNIAGSGTKTANREGSEAFAQTPELSLASILLTSFANDQFYRGAGDTFKELKDLIVACDKEFVAKAAVYARNEFGMRSISHVCASELAQHVSGKPWAKSFYTAVIRRPDDMLEILSYYKAHNGKTIPNAMKKGFALAFDKFDGYQLGKYRGEGKSIKLIDIVNQVHPVPIERNAEALKQLVAGTLKSKDTWEKNLTQAGQKAESAEEKEELKKDVWTDLVKSKKIGYFALLKNLRNILEQAPEIVGEACEMLTDKKLIKGSLVMPFRYSTAITEINKISSEGSRDVIIALNKAIDISCDNIPEFDGKTLIVTDFSGSMDHKLSDKGTMSYRGIGSLFSALMAKSNNADVMIFGSHAAYVGLNPMDSTLTINSILDGLNKGFSFSGHNNTTDVGHGTNFHEIFKTASKKYDRVIIFSDMQGWMGGGNLGATFSDYKRRYDADPFIYSFDLAGYGTMQFPERNVFCLAGFSDKVFDIMKMLEKDRNALINEIKKVDLTK